MSFVSELPHKKILILGAGKTGTAVSSYLKQIGSNYEIVDDQAEATSDVNIRSTVPEQFGADFAIVSPGWKRDHPLVIALMNSGIEVISELDFAWKLKQDLRPNQSWVAVTGTNGKTTTVQMLESILAKSKKRAIACGNVGLPVTLAVTSEENFEVLAIELSSFQIEWSELPEYEAVAILNIAEDHIDWHESFTNYANSKMKLLAKSKIGILNLSDPEIILRSTSSNSKKVFYSLATPQTGELGVVEEILVDRAFVGDSAAAEVIAELSDIQPTVPHNVSNALAASGIALALGIPHPVIKSGLSAFKMDHHRLEHVLSTGGINWVNDSKATNPHAAIASLNSHLSNVWLAGGLAKGAKMDELVQRCNSRIKAALLFGRDADLIAISLAQFAPTIPVFRFSNENGSKLMMDEIVKQAQEIATAGDTVLLAPACASMDQFDSYSHRGELFTDSVKRLAK